VNGGLSAAIDAAGGYAQIISGVGGCSSLAACSLGSISIIDGANSIYKAHGFGDSSGPHQKSLYAIGSHSIFGDYRYGAVVDKFSSLVSVSRGFTRGPAEAKNDYELFREIGSSGKGTYDFAKEVEEW